MEELKTKTEELTELMDDVMHMLDRVPTLNAVLKEARKYVKAWEMLKRQTNTELSDFTYERDFHSANSCRMTLESMESIEKEVGI